MTEKIQDLIYKSLKDNQDRTPRGHLGCSIIGRECQREVWYIWRWAKSPDFDGRLLRLFRRGQEEEPYVVSDLRAIGLEVHDEDSKTGDQFRISDLGGHMGGSLDGAVSNVPGHGPTWMVLEIKTSGVKPFTKLEKNGVKKEKFEHYTQMQLYMRGTGMKKALYFAVCKDNDKIYTEIVDFDESEAKTAFNKAKAILESTTPPGKISEHPSWYKCKMCDQRNHCQGDEAPEVNCRTCVHATPEIDPNRARLWTCAKKGKHLNESEQLAGCDEHLFIPKMINFAEAIDANPDEGWVDYKSDQGVYFRNSGKNYAESVDEDKSGDSQPPWSSNDIHHLGARVLTDDPLLESIRRNFAPTKILKTTKNLEK